mmetsp:Transcript_13688/g.49069  ORF Transcript_13688/g.49069 Transcript_13688/m.49069 type:complete len:305 (+) Transcript_13688:618-1532(+)
MRYHPRPSVERRHEHDASRTDVAENSAAGSGSQHRAQREEAVFAAAPQQRDDALRVPRARHVQRRGNLDRRGSAILRDAFVRVRAVPAAAAATPPARLELHRGHDDVPGRRVHVRVLASRARGRVHLRPRVLDVRDRGRGALARRRRGIAASHGVRARVDASPRVSQPALRVHLQRLHRARDLLVVVVRAPRHDRASGRERGRRPREEPVPVDGERASVANRAKAREPRRRLQRVSRILRVASEVEPAARDDDDVRVRGRDVVPAPLRALGAFEGLQQRDAAGGGDHARHPVPAVKHGVDPFQQ